MNPKKEQGKAKKGKSKLLLGSKERVEQRKQEASERARVLNNKGVRFVATALASEELPPRKELAKFLGQVAADFLKDPQLSIENGLKREKRARDLYKSQTGQDAETHLSGSVKFVKGKVGKLIKETKENPAEAIVGAAGVAGSVAGGAVGGIPGQLIGDLVGALAARKVIEGHRAYKKAREGLSVDGNRIKTLKDLTGKTWSEIKSAKGQKQIEEDLVGDVSGWAVGNATASALEAAMGGIPLSGAAVAIGTVPSFFAPVSKTAHELVREGRTPVEASRIALEQWATSGDKREAEWRAEFSRHIKEVKANAQKTAATPGIQQRRGTGRG